VVLLISVIQYVPKDELPALLADLRRLLKPGGLLLVGDVLDPDGGMIADASALLRFAWAEGFFVDAVLGLAKTLVSDYSKVRGRIGLSAYALEEILKVLEAAGFAARPLARNIGHARHRRSVAARRTE
jgi:SAM-dependent methyltransferase